ncbi:MAG: hypothetical protein HZB91_05390 [Elusimicrobia bacterium]|nr:hypothetical protein [Elusimicrobiota bacterium]
MSTPRRKPEPAPAGPVGLGWLVLFDPRAAARECGRAESLASSLWIYAAFLVAFAVFTGLKPPGFPGGGSMPFTTEGSGHLAQAAFWNLPMEAVWIVFLMGLVRFFRSGTLAVRLAIGVAWAAWSLILVVLYLQVHSMGKAAFLAGTAVWLGLFYPCLRGVPASEWRQVTGFMLALNAVFLPLAAPLTVSAMLRHENAFIAGQVVMGLWLLWSGASGLRELTGLRLPRAFMAILLSVVFQAALVLSLYAAGIVPREILMVMLFG